MPLSEISVNFIGKDANTTMFSDSQTESIVKSYTERDPERESTPSAIQSMLKNATETGNVGQFATKPTRIPHPAPDSNLRKPRLHHGPDGLAVYQSRRVPTRERPRRRRCMSGGQDSLQSCRGTNGFSVISMQRSGSQRSVHPHIYQDQNKDQHTFSMSQGSQIGYSLSNHQSYANLRPRSPFAYPTRLKRPGYRPSSPALTDFNGTDVRTHVGFEVGVGSRSFSPLSRNTMAKIAPGYPLITNRSLPSLQSSPPLFTRSRHRSVRTPTTPMRSPAMRPLSNHSMRSFSNEIRRNHSHTSFWRGAQSPSPSPIYYDYTEGFDEQHHLHSSIVSIASLMEKSVVETQSQDTVHELDGNPAENKNPMATHGEVNDTQVCKALNEAESPSPATAPSHFLAQMREWESEETDCVTRPTNTENLMAMGRFHQHDSHEPDQSFHSEDTPIGSTTGHHILSSSRRRRYGEHFLSHLKRPAREAESTSIMVHKTHSQGPSSILLEPFPSAQEHIEDGRFVVFRAQTRPASIVRMIPTLSPGQANLGRNKQEVPTQRPLQTGLPQEMFGAANTEIYAPIPKRSTSTRSREDRFSRIFSIEDMIIEPDQAMLRAEVADRAQRKPSSREVPVAASDNIESHSALSLALSPCSSNYSTKQVSGGESERGGSTSGAALDYLVECHNEQEEGRSKSLLIRPRQSISREGLRCADGQSFSWRLRDEPSPGRYVKKSSRKEKENASQNPHQSDIADPFQLSPLNRSFKQIPHEAIPKRSSSKVSINAHHHALRSTVQNQNEPRAMPLLEAATVVPWEFDEPPSQQEISIAKYKLGTRFENKSTSSLPDSRSANLDSSFSWVNQSDHIDVVQPRLRRVDTTQANQTPKFRLKVTRASNSTGGTVKVTKREMWVTLAVSRIAWLTNHFGVGTLFVTQSPRVLEDLHNRPRYTPILRLYRLASLKKSIECHRGRRKSAFGHRRQHCISPMSAVSSRMIARTKSLEEVFDIASRSSKPSQAEQVLSTTSGLLSADKRWHMENPRLDAEIVFAMAVILV